MSSFIFNNFKERFLKGEVPEFDTWKFYPVNSNFKEYFEKDDVKLENYRTINDFKNAATASNKKFDKAISNMQEFEYVYKKQTNDDTTVKPPFITIENIDDLIKLNLFNPNIRNLKKYFFTKNGDLSAWITEFSKKGFYFVKSKEEFAWCCNRANGDQEGETERNSVYNNYINIVLGDNIGEDKKYSTISHQLGKYSDRPFMGLLFGFGFSFVNVELKCNNISNGLVGFLGKTGCINNVYFKNSEGFATRVICNKKLNIPHMKKDACDISTGLFAGVNYGLVSFCRVDGPTIGSKARVEFSKFVPSVYMVQNKSEDPSTPVLDSGDTRNVNCNVFYPNYYCINSPGNIIPYCGYFSEGIYGTFSASDHKPWPSPERWDFKDFTNLKSIGVLFKTDDLSINHVYTYDHPSHYLTAKQEGENEFDLTDEKLGIFGIYGGNFNTYHYQTKYIPFLDRPMKPHEFNRAAYYVSPLVGTNFGTLLKNTINANVYLMGTFVGFEGGLCGKLASGTVDRNYVNQDIYDNGGNRDWFVSTATNDISNQPELIHMNLQECHQNSKTNAKKFNGIYLNVGKLKNVHVKGINYTVSADFDFNGDQNTINLKKKVFGDFVNDNCLYKFSTKNIKNQKVEYNSTSGLMSLSAKMMYDYNTTSAVNYYTNTLGQNYNDTLNIELNTFKEVSAIYLTKNEGLSANSNNYFSDILDIPNGNIIVQKGEKKNRYVVNKQLIYPVDSVFSGADLTNNVSKTYAITANYNNNYIMKTVITGTIPNTCCAPIINYITMDGIVFETQASPNENDVAFINPYKETSGYINADLCKVVSAANVKLHLIGCDAQAQATTKNFNIEHRILDFGDVTEGDYTKQGIYSKNEGNIWYERTSAYGLSPLSDNNKSYSQFYQRFFLDKTKSNSYIAELKSIYNVGGVCGMHAYGLDTTVKDNKVYLENNIPVYLKEVSGKIQFQDSYEKDYGALNRFGGFAAISEIRTSLLSDYDSSYRPINMSNNYFTYKESSLEYTSKVTGIESRVCYPYNCGTGAVYSLGTASPTIAEMKPIFRKTPGIQSYIKSLWGKKTDEVTYERKTHYTNDLGLLCAQNNPNGFAVDFQTEGFFNNQFNYMKNHWKTFNNSGVWPTDLRDMSETLYDWNNNQIQKMNYGVCSSDPLAMTTVADAAIVETGVRVSDIGDYYTQKRIGGYSYFGSSLCLNNSNGNYYNAVKFMNSSKIKATNIPLSAYKVPLDNIVPRIKESDAYKSNIFTYYREEPTSGRKITEMDYKVKFGTDNRSQHVGYWLQGEKHEGYKGQGGYDYDGSVLHLGTTYNPTAIREMISKYGYCKSTGVSAEDFQGFYVTDSKGNNVMFLETAYGDMDKLNTWTMQLPKSNKKQSSDISGCILEIE